MSDSHPCHPGCHHPPLPLWFCDVLLWVFFPCSVWTFFFRHGYCTAETFVTSSSLSEWKSVLTIHPPTPPPPHLSAGSEIKSGSPLSQYSPLPQRPDRHAADKHKATELTHTVSGLKKNFGPCCSPLESVKKKKHKKQLPFLFICGFGDFSFLFLDVLLKTTEQPLSQVHPPSHSRSHVKACCDLPQKLKWLPGSGRRDATVGRGAHLRLSHS